MAKHQNSHEHPETGDRFKAGRPAYDRDVLADMVEAYEDGPGTVNELCRHLGVHTSTFYACMKENDRFYRAVMRVRERADDRVEASLFDRAVGYSYTEISRKSGSGKDGGVVDEETVHEKELAPDVGAQMNWLKNRRPDKWRDKVELEVTGALGEMVNRMRKELEGE